MDNLNLYVLPCTYRVFGLSSRYRITISFGGTHWYCMLDGHSCLSKREGLFLFQRLPSAITDEERADTGFDTVDLALRALERALQNPDETVRTTLLKQLGMKPPY